MSRTRTRGTASKRMRRVATPPVAALASIPAGPQLAAALAGFDLRSLTGFDLVLLLQARNRQANHERGMLLETAAEVLRRTDPDNARDEDLAAWKVRANELRTSMVLTRVASQSLAAITTTVTEELPALGAAMRQGVLDQPRARVFQEWTRDLCQRHARAVVDALLPAAPGMTTGELAAAIREVAIELDPEWARRRYERTLHTRHVRGVLNHDGTATLSGHNVSADEVAAVCDRLDRLAARVKAAGHPAKLAHLRADIFLGRLDRYVGLTDEQLYEQLVATIPDDCPEPEPFGVDPYADEDADSTDAGTASTVNSHEDPAVQEDPDEDGDPPPDDGGSNAPNPEQEAVAGSNAADGVGQYRRSAGWGLHLLAGLGTIAGLDRRPAQLLGFGVVHAELARRVTAAVGAAWYVTLVNPDGSPIDVFPVRVRPSTPWWQGPAPGYRSPEVWLRLTPEELAVLTHDPPPGWERVIATIAARVTSHPGGPPNGDPGRRLPSEPLRRWLWVRDTRCLFPGCRIAPHRTEPDHTIPHAAGGPTLDSNLGSACGPDHDLRHQHGWRVDQPSPGRVLWTSPLGHEYERHVPSARTPAPPMAEPVRPDETNRYLIQPHEDVPWWAEHTCKRVLDPPPPQPEPPPEPSPPPPPPAPVADEPPF